MADDAIQPKQCTQHFYEIDELGTEAILWEVRCHVLQRYFDQQSL